MEFLNRAKQCFAGEPFESAYKKWQAPLTKINSLRRLKTARLVKRRSSFELACSLVTIPRSARTQESSGKPHENGFPRGFPYGFPHPPALTNSRATACKVPKPEPGRGKNRGKGGSDPTGSPFGHRVAPALFILRSITVRTSPQITTAVQL